MHADLAFKTYRASAQKGESKMLIIHNKKEIGKKKLLINAKNENVVNH